MARTPLEFIKYVGYVWRGTSRLSILKRIVLKILSPIVKTDSAYIAVRYRDLKPLVEASFRAQEEQGITAAVLERFDDLDSLGDSNPDEIMLAALKAHFEQGPNRIAILALLREPTDIGPKIIGYVAYDCATFSYWEGRLKDSLPSDCMYITDAYVHPEHRGKRIHLAIRKLLSGFCKERGIKKTVGLIKTHNIPSIKAHLHPTEESIGMLRGTIRHTTFFGGLFDRTTPGKTVVAILNAPMPIHDDSPRKSSIDPALLEPDSANTTEETVRLNN